jgi:hypothetical protein
MEEKIFWEFEDIAEKCLAGELKGNFLFRISNHGITSVHSDNLERNIGACEGYPYPYWISVDGGISNSYTVEGMVLDGLRTSDEDIIDFIPEENVSQKQ